MKQRWIGLFLIISLLLSGCSIKEARTDKIKDLEFTVVGEECLEDELKGMLEEKKKEEFKVTYMDNQYLYICIGYGEQKTGGYSIMVNDLYLAENAIYVDTNLIGPKEIDRKVEVASYPYIVIKTEFIDKTVVFD